MKHNKWINLVVLAVMALVVLACGISFNGGDSGDSEIQQTLQALQQTQTAAAAAGGQTQSTQEPTDDSQEQEEQQEEQTPTITTTPCNVSHMTGETVPDGTNFDSGDPFTKTWTLRNDGACVWTTDYKFVFVDGDRMGGATSQNLSSSVAPGESVTMAVDLTAPSTDGLYKGVWRWKSDDGKEFGNYWVQISVGPTPAPFAVTGVSFYMSHTTIDTGCPNDINVKAEIKSSAAGKVTYYWTDSAGGSSSTKSITFTEAGTEIVDYNVTVSATGDYWAKLYIDNPNHQWFGPKEFHVNCTP